MTTTDQLPSADPATWPDYLERGNANSPVKWYDTVLDLEPLHVYHEAAAEISDGYQRSLDQKRISELMHNFDPSEARQIYVSLRETPDGPEYFILDGQHTSFVLRTMGYNRWPCRVFEGLSVPEEALRFAEYQRNSKPISKYIVWGARVVSGDPVTNQIEAVLDARGLRIGSTKERIRENFVAIGISNVLTDAFEKGGAPLVESVLDVSIEAWGKSKDAFHSRVTAGLVHLLYFANRPIDRERIVAVLKNTTPKLVVEKAKGETGSAGAGLKLAGILVKLYNDGFDTFEKLKGAGLVKLLDNREAADARRKATGGVFFGSVTDEAFSPPKPREAEKAVKATKATKATTKKVTAATTTSTKAAAAATPDAEGDPDVFETPGAETLAVPTAAPVDLDPDDGWEYAEPETSEDGPETDIEWSESE